MLHAILHSQSHSYYPYTPPDNDYSTECSTCLLPLRDEDNPDAPIVAHSTADLSDQKHPSHLSCALQRIKDNSSCASCRATIDGSTILPLHERIRVKYITTKNNFIEGSLKGIKYALISIKEVNFIVFLGLLKTTNPIAAIIVSTGGAPTGVIAAAIGGAAGNIVASEVANFLSLGCELKHTFSTYGTLAGTSLAILVDAGLKISGSIITLETLGFIALGIGGLGIAFVGTVIAIRQLEKHYPQFFLGETSQIQEEIVQIN